jgi:membrane peptidoglycan carboxypeptidase
VALALLLGAALGLLLVGAGFIGYASIAAALPAPDELQARASQFNSTLIYDRAGGLLNEVADPNYGRRTAVTVAAISPHLTAATIATEDPNFYEHPGVDPVGIARALYHAVKYRDLDSTPGGSTITQQLVKLTFLSAERTLTRKIKEAILAAEITRRYPKDKVLEIYLNEIYYGNLAYGIEAAAETYFDKRASDLTLAEAALLAGLPQAPAYYDPYTRLWNADGTPGAVKRRQSAVLTLMVRHDAITPAQADAAWQAPIVLKPLRQTYTSKNPHFVQYARSQVEQTLGPELLAKGGLRIHTSLDPRIQAIAEDEVAKQVKALAGQGAGNAALVALQPKTGEILALVGSADFYSEKISGQINMAISPRQPGSAIKPFTYLAAFEMPAAVDAAPAAEKSPQISAIEPPGYWTPATAIMDIRTEFPDGARPPYVPANYDDREHGLVTVRAALANSYNIPAVKALEHVGLERLKELARRVGITTLTRPDYGLALTLGGGDVTLLELTGAYAVLANNGVRVAPSPVACVLDADGVVIWRGNGADVVASTTVAACRSARIAAARPVTPAPAQAVLNPQHVYLMTSILADLEARRPMFGNSAALLSLTDRPAAAKTGTTNDYRDAWIVGYTPDLAVGAWVGNADYKPMQKVAGGIGAAPIWHNVMQRSLQGKPAQPFSEPPGIVRIKVCADSGTLPSAACPAQREEIFAANQGPLPAQYDLHQRVRIDKVSGRLATELTPADRIEERDVMLFPIKYRAWAEAHGIPQPAIELPAYAFRPELRLDAPASGNEATGVIAVTGRVHLPEPLSWRVEYGVGPSPIGWGVIAGPLNGDREGQLADWDTATTAKAHDVYDFSVRLAAYDAALPDYPVAVSNAAYLTVLRPTSTPTASPTASASATASPTGTPTGTPTPTATRPATATATYTPTASPTAAASPTPTPSASPTRSATVTAGPTVGATATSPATATVTVAPATATATSAPATATPRATASATPAAPGNTVQAVITAPLAGSRLKGAVEIIGDAHGAGFTGYQLEFAAGLQPQAASWQQLSVPQVTPVTNGILGVWQTQRLAPGAYWLRLEVFTTAGTTTTSQVLVEVVR